MDIVVQRTPTFNIEGSGDFSKVPDEFKSFALKLYTGVSLSGESAALLLQEMVWGPVDSGW